MRDGHTQGGEDGHQKTGRWTARLRRTHTRRGRQTPEDREMDGQTETDIQGGEEKHQQTETGRQRETDTHEREKRYQQTDRWTDRFGHTRRAGQTTADSETDGQRETDTHVGENRHRQTMDGGRQV